MKFWSAVSQGGESHWDVSEAGVQKWCVAVAKATTGTEPVGFVVQQCEIKTNAKSVLGLLNKTANAHVNKSYSLQLRPGTGRRICDLPATTTTT